MTASRTETVLPLALIAVAQAGDQGAIASLLEVSQPDIRRYARRSCRAADSDDAVQEVLWLLQIVRRECMRLVRRDLSRMRSIETVTDDAAFASGPALDCGSTWRRPSNRCRIIIASCCSCVMSKR